MKEIIKIAQNIRIAKESITAAKQLNPTNKQLRKGQITTFLTFTAICLSFVLVVILVPDYTQEQRYICLGILGVLEILYAILTFIVTPLLYRKWKKERSNNGVSQEQ